MICLSSAHYCPRVANKITEELTLKQKIKKPLLVAPSTSSESSSSASSSLDFSSVLTICLIFLESLFLEFLVVWPFEAFFHDTSWNLHWASLMNWPSREIRCSMELRGTDVWRKSWRVVNDSDFSETKIDGVVTQTLTWWTRLCHWLKADLTQTTQPMNGFVT